MVVPDHMGFGKSETPQDRSYWLQDHIDNLERFVLALDLAISLSSCRISAARWEWVSPPVIPVAFVG